MLYSRAPFYGNISTTQWFQLLCFSDPPFGGWWTTFQAPALWPEAVYPQSANATSRRKSLTILQKEIPYCRIAKDKNF